MKLDGISKLKFKRDAYMRSRGAPAMLKISCAKCTNYIMSYQKDGPGPLLRCYLDRIHHPESLSERQKQVFDKNESPKLSCVECNEVVGQPMIYEKESRPAYNMVPGSFKRKKIY
jgi:hypothetical protein